MKKLALIAIAAASMLSASTAFAGWYDAYGYYHPTCGYIQSSSGPIWVCG